MLKVQAKGGNVQPPVALDTGAYPEVCGGNKNVGIHTTDSYQKATSTLHRAPEYAFLLQGTKHV